LRASSEPDKRHVPGCKRQNGLKKKKRKKRRKKKGKKNDDKRAKETMLGMTR
jgi:hypothetical protein